ncbi:MAG TPA: alpha/beta hydrolase [Asticcacaulis sp.]|nr:alpha/beta hydrolase [Asticcacaulis sp.]
MNRRAWPKPALSIDLWPTPPAPPRPGLQETVTDASKDPAFHHRRMQGIVRPRIEVFPAARPNEGAVLIIPGGGFSWTSFDVEGYLLAQRLNAAGMTALVLFYRLANDGWANRVDIGTIDALRAMRVIRQHAAKLSIDPQRVAAIGFSAGGFLSASLATRFDEPLYPAQDAADSLSARPDAAALMYPVASLDPAIAYSGAVPSLFDGHITSQQIAHYSPDRRVSAKTPPCFLVQAEDDPVVPVANTLSFRAALKAHGVADETHLFAQGGHGFGLTPSDLPHRIWPDLYINCLRQQGIAA